MKLLERGDGDFFPGLGYSKALYVALHGKHDATRLYENLKRILGLTWVSGSETLVFRGQTASPQFGNGLVVAMLGTVRRWHIPPVNGPPLSGSTAMLPGTHATCRKAQMNKVTGEAILSGTAR